MNQFRTIFYPLALMFCAACLSVSLFADEPVQLHCAGNCQTCHCGPILTVHASELPHGAACSNYLLIGHLYALSLDPQTKVATWCCYRATKSTGDTRNAVGRNWLSILPDVTLEPSDYVGPLYDMGHLAPLAALKNSPYAFELNCMANIAPQSKELNRGPWLKIETLVRQMAETHESVDVIVGPLYEANMEPLKAADEPHRVPSHYWALLFPEGAEGKAYIVDQTCGRTDSLSEFGVSVDDVSRRSGLTFPRKR